MSIAGTRLAGRYTLIRPLGRGASSVVYLAIGDDGKPYTIKLFHEQLKENARREASMRVSSPNLGEVIEVSQLQGHPAVVGRLILGQPLFQFYKSRPALLRVPGEFIQTLLDVLSALQALHSAGILHRDIKPDNIIVKAGGHAVLVDYDLSGPIREAFQVPRRIGTEAFQSPEARRSELLDPQSDLWSVGILLCWGLYAQVPDEETPRTAQELILPDSPLAHLRELATQLLRFDPAQRPSNAAQVREQVVAAAQADGLQADRLL